MAEAELVSRREGDVVVLSFNRPERLNALSREVLLALGVAIKAAVAEGARALVLTGAGRGFCSGADLLGKSAAISDDAGALLEEIINPLLEQLATLPIPVISAVNGAAAGAGVGFALAGDFVLMARSAYLLLAFVNIGLVPDAGVSFVLPRLVGRARALEMMMLGERIGAEKAADWGLIYRVSEDGAVLEDALSLAHRLAAGPTRALGLMRGVVRKSLDSSYTDTLWAERVAQREAGSTADFREGVQAFLEKRKASFSGQ